MASGSCHWRPVGRSRLAAGVAGLASLVMAAAVHAQGNPFEDLLGGGGVPPAIASLPTEPQPLADALMLEVETLRGLEFLAGITVRNQSIEDFAVYVDAQIEKSIPPERLAALGPVAKKLGLYNGPMIEDAAALLSEFSTQSAAAYYDPEASEFRVLYSDQPIMMLAIFYVHELYHGLQDQHFDLDAYMLEGMEQGLDDDELLARQSVVEGEATYFMYYWFLQQTLGREPPRLIVSAFLAMNSLATSLATAGLLPASMAGDIDTMDGMPAFLVEPTLSAYLNGATFIHTVYGKQGWAGLERLYSNPPQSSEQILHPDKWFAGDQPVAIELPDLEQFQVLADWQLLDTNVIGELQWRVIFREFGLNLMANSAAAGWGGDRYAVLGRGEDLLLLLYTSWDSEQEAAEFVAAYNGLLGVKYNLNNESVRVEQRGLDVLIVEGGEADRIDDYFEAVTRFEKSTPSNQPSSQN